MYNAMNQQQQAGAQQGTEAQQGQPNEKGKDSEVTDVDYEEVK